MRPSLAPLSIAAGSAPPSPACPTGETCQSLSSLRLRALRLLQYTVATSKATAAIAPTTPATTVLVFGEDDAGVDDDATPAALPPWTPEGDGVEPGSDSAWSWNGDGVGAVVNSSDESASPTGVISEASSMAAAKSEPPM